MLISAHASNYDGDASLSVTTTARRAQIVAHAIEVIAELGYQKATYAEIARRAGLSSTGLISYHFANRDELVARVVEEVIGSISSYMYERMQSVAGATAALQTYIEGTVEFIATHRAEMTALLAIFLSGAVQYEAADDVAVTSHVERILRAGQESGEFRDFDTRVVASAIQRAVEGATFALQRQPDLDLAAYGRELSALFDRAVRAEP